MKTLSASWTTAANDEQPNDKDEPGPDHCQQDGGAFRCQVAKDAHHWNKQPQEGRQQATSCANLSAFLFN
jgi:hypothetical protein